jgi:hypothetical protein
MFRSLNNQLPVTLLTSNDPLQRRPSCNDVSLATTTTAQRRLPCNDDHGTTTILCNDDSLQPRRSATTALWHACNDDPPATIFPTTTIPCNVCNDVPLQRRPSTRRPAATTTPAMATSETTTPTLSQLALAFLPLNLSLQPKVGTSVCALLIQCFQLYRTNTQKSSFQSPIRCNLALFWCRPLEG